MTSTRRDLLEKCLAVGGVSVLSGFSPSAVLEAQVIGIPNERYGEEVMAWVRLRPGATVTPTGLEQFCQAQIAGFKVPKYWKLVDEFPMTVTGKVQKFRMREAAIAELGLQKAAGIITA